ncbi:FAD-dependent oxidoreductase [Prosthecobacter sp.]|uniref:NAD(P)/FAD-dependent oxidoreductase n=1 Tax=Prosthecobacter sp. TaxID=1965333 RepID=UPI00248A3A14|nr:FAD-dependent oxidoreductase [Prosthecobacter sp.]MDI1311383.1 FAD-dependent oxidoreductase [Prosthecobacter sp.]
MPTHEAPVDVLIIGTGVSGLIAAREIQRGGRSVLLLDKGRGLGGRLASRRIGAATFDHGAQFITTRDARFEGILKQGAEAGIMKEWCQGFSAAADGHTRWRGQPAMTAFAKYLAQGLEVRMEKQVVALRRSGDRYSVETSTGDFYTASAVLLTPPVPQSLALLTSGEIELDPAMRTRLEAIQYECCLAVMAVLKGPSLIPPPGGLVPASGPVSWIADNQLKGISAEPAVTIHASQEFSLAHWDDDRMESGRMLLEASRPWLGAEVVSYQVHGWRYSKPLQVDANPCALLQASPPLVMAGDAFAGPRVEGAALSGFASAETLLARLSRP